MRVRTSYDYEPLDVDTMNTRRRVHNISDNMYDDQDALSAASRRQDQRLLSNITDRMDEIHTSPPVTVKHRHYLHHSAKPPLPPSAGVHHQRHVSRSHVPHVSVGAPSIKTVVLRHGARASSVPPKSAALEAEVEQYIEGTHRPAPQRHYDYSAESVYHRPSYRAASEPPAGNHHVANMAVKQAKLYLDRIENELGVSDRNYMADDSSVYLPAPRAVPRTGGSYGHYNRRYVPMTPSVARSSRAHEIEAHLDLYSDEIPGPPPASYSNLRQRTSEARNKLDAAKSMYDRYLPVYMGPETDVQYNVEHKYNQLASRAGEGGGMPELEPYRPRSSADFGGSPAPYRPASRPTGSYSSPVRSSAIPPVSDTRARIREVLCKTKKDPGYY